VTSKEQRTQYRDSLIQFANDLGFDVELDSPMEDHVEKWKAKLLYGLKTSQITQEQFDEHIEDECRPAGDCNYLTKKIRVREGKGINGQVATLVHELCHALGLGGESLLMLGGSTYVELAAESITEFVTTALGIDRTARTSARILNYGFGGYLLSPVTATFTKIILENIGLDPTTWEPANVST
jgi:hypothetical protein